MNSSYDLSLEEQKIILTLASMVQPNDEEFKPYIFKISDFMLRQSQADGFFSYNIVEGREVL